MPVSAILNVDLNGYNQIHPGAHLIEAINAMADRNFNGLVVLGENQRLIGILTDQDVLRIIASNDGHLSHLLVSDAMSTNVVTCSPETSFSQALARMGKHRIRHLVVLDQDTVVGILSIKDVLQKVHEDESLEIKVLREMAASVKAMLLQNTM